uniref:Uncharacterized protein n=1 Tax=Nelumbo nucifera TaxID=4432 RepID=A0A822XIP8_NELNU|nr:TPA_asm: hypothetical protein HUJ06_020464 [Nelumbo nucifera]
MVEGNQTLNIERERERALALVVGNHGSQAHCDCSIGSGDNHLSENVTASLDVAIGHRKWRRQTTNSFNKQARYSFPLFSYRGRTVFMQPQIPVFEKVRPPIFPSHFRVFHKTNMGKWNILGIFHLSHLFLANQTEP